VPCAPASSEAPLQIDVVAHRFRTARGAFLLFFFLTARLLFISPQERFSSPLVISFPPSNLPFRAHRPPCSPFRSPGRLFGYQEQRLAALIHPGLLGPYASFLEVPFFPPPSPLFVDFEIVLGGVWLNLPRRIPLLPPPNRPPPSSCHPGVFRTPPRLLRFQSLFSVERMM